MTTLTDTDASAIAKKIVLALCGGKYVSPPVTMVDTYPVPPSGRIFLAGRPVKSVASVTIDGAAVAYTRRNNHELLLTLPTGYGSTDICQQTRQVVVTYTYGLDTLPIEVTRAIAVLADELLAAANGDACRIPERVTSVTRQGVSWTMIDPGDFLDKGRTGIYEIDLLIGVVNPGRARRRVRVFSPVAVPIPDRSRP